MSLTQPLKPMSLSIEFLRKLEKTIVAYEIEIAPIKINFINFINIKHILMPNSQSKLARIV